MKLAILGFSRGAYFACIMASFLHLAREFESLQEVRPTTLTYPSTGLYPPQLMTIIVRPSSRGASPRFDPSDTHPAPGDLSQTPHYLKKLTKLGLKNTDSSPGRSTF